MVWAYTKDIEHALFFFLIKKEPECYVEMNQKAFCSFPIKKIQVCVVVSVENRI